MVKLLGAALILLIMATGFLGIFYIDEFVLKNKISDKIIGLLSFETKEKQIGPYPDKWACDFYQIPWPGANKNHVNCQMYKAGDTFCVLSLGSISAKAEICDEDGLIVCSNPCKGPIGQIIPSQCPYDINRERGVQAAPLNNCQ